MALVKISGIEPESIVDGRGFRYVVFTQGCPHHCLGCHNPQTHDFEGGHMADTEDMLREIALNPLLKGITLSGGEPFCQPQPLVELARRVHAMGKDVTAYTGYTYEQLLEKNDPKISELLDEVDTLVDGPFLLAQRDLTLRFRGSTNQRVLDLKKSRQEHHLVLDPVDEE